MNAINRTAGSSGSTSKSITLAVGSNTLTIVVTARYAIMQDIYTITITRAAGVADYDGDGKTQPATYDPACGKWYVQLTGGGMLVNKDKGGYV